MKRLIQIILVAAATGFLLPGPASAGTIDFLDGIAIGAGYHQAAANRADEYYTASIKIRGKVWEYGIDACNSEGSGGVSTDNFLFLWTGWIEEFDRPKWQDYGIYVGAGAGFFLLDDNLIDWPGGPFVIIGWDFSHQAGLEGKCGYFGDHYWGTAMFYWYFD